MPRTLCCSLASVHPLFLSSLSHARTEVTKKKIWNSNVLSHKLFQEQCVTAWWTHETIFKFGLFSIREHIFTEGLWKMHLLVHYFDWTCAIESRNWKTEVIPSASSFYLHNLIEVAMVALKRVRSYKARSFAICLHWPLILRNACYTIFSFHGSNSVIIHSKIK